MKIKLRMIKYELRNITDEFISSSYCHRVFIPPGRFIAQKRIDGYYHEILNIRTCRVVFEKDRGFTVWIVPENKLQIVHNIKNN